jgi:very-short-patch-repair endonuclease
LTSNRDRALVAAGWIVLRFAAREVMRDADSCVTEVLRFLRRATGVLRVG